MLSQEVKLNTNKTNKKQNLVKILVYQVEYHWRHEHLFKLLICEFVHNECQKNGIE